MIFPFPECPALSSLCPYSPFLYVFLGSLFCDPLHGSCHGLLHVHDSCQDSCHNHPLGCGLIHGALHGLPCVQSHTLLHEPVHFLGYRTFQSPVLSPGPDQGQFCGHGGYKCLCLSGEKKSHSKREKKYIIRVKSFSFRSLKLGLSKITKFHFSFILCVCLSSSHLFIYSLL